MTYIGNTGKTHKFVRAMINTEQHDGNLRCLCSYLIDHRTQVLRVVAHVEISDQVFAIRMFSEAFAAILNSCADLILAVGLVQFRENTFEVLQLIALRFSTPLRDARMGNVFVELKDLLVEREARGAGGIARR